MALAGWNMPNEWATWKVLLGVDALLVLMGWMILALYTI